MKLRQGRHNARTLYVQIEDEPSDRDTCVGFVVNGETAQALCRLVNAFPPGPQAFFLRDVLFAADLADG